MVGQQSYASLFVEAILIVLIVGIGVYMALVYAYPTPPFLSGVVFLFIGFLLLLFIADRNQIENDDESL